MTAGQHGFRKPFTVEGCAVVCTQIVPAGARAEHAEDGYVTVDLTRSSVEWLLSHLPAGEAITRDLAACLDELVAQQTPATARNPDETL